MGACAGDYDSDGDPDLYITGWGQNALFQNRGDGIFADVTTATRVGDARWSVSCAFADFDRDGDLDLWVVNYVDAKRSDNPYCGDVRRALRFYCHPLKYEPLPSNVYRNDGGTFADVTAAAGVGALRSNGMGIVVADYDADGWPDVFVANDTMPNFLFRNQGKWKFAETGLVAGVAVASDGKPGRAWVSMPPTTTATVSWTSPSPTSISRCTACIEGSNAASSPTRRARAQSAFRACRSWASASAFSITTTTRDSIWRSRPATFSTTLRSSDQGPRMRSATCCSAA
jgi:hypothetical protein